MKKTVLSAALIVSMSSAWAGGNPGDGKAAVEKFGCAACHGADFKSPIDPSYPKLAGQHQDYLAHALVAYRRGGGVVNGRVNPIMNAQAGLLTDKDIQNITAYISSLPGTLVLQK